MVKKILSDYRAGWKQNLKKYFNTPGQGWWITWCMYYLVMSKAQNFLQMVIMIVLAVTVCIFPKVCPNKIEKTMYLCPVSMENRCKYIRTGYVLRVGVSMVLSFSVMSAMGFLKTSSSMVLIGDMMVLIWIINMDVESFLLNCYNIVYKNLYRVTKVFVILLAILSFIISGAATESVEIKVAAGLLLAAALLTIPVVKIFWTQICMLTADYEMTYGNDGGTI